MEAYCNTHNWNVDWENIFQTFYLCSNSWMIVEGFEPKVLNLEVKVCWRKMICSTWGTYEKSLKYYLRQVFWKYEVNQKN
jgi:hypothetical protein